MSSVVIPFPHPEVPKSEVAQFVRIGEFHHQFGNMHASGHLPVKRAVVGASRITRQKNLIRSLQNEQVEIVLDPEAAELSALGRFQTHVKNAPWLRDLLDKPLGPQDFNADCMAAIARLAIEYGVDAVLAPTHFLSDPTYAGWLGVDLRACEMLREALDREGGKNIEIEYVVIQSAAGLSDATFKKRLVEGLAGVPANGLWFRVSGLGKEAGPLKTRSLIRILSGFHNLGKPIVLDYCSGLNAEAALAFGVVSGVSYGVMELDQFHAGSWHKLPTARNSEDEFGRQKYVQVPGLGRSFNAKEFELLAKAQGGRRTLIQSELSTATSIEEMIRDRKQQAALQMVRSFKRLEDVPDLNRARFFLDGPMKEMERRAREVSRLKPSASLADTLGVDLVSLRRRTAAHHENLSKVANALEKLDEERGVNAPRARACAKRKALSDNARKDQKK